MSRVEVFVDETPGETRGVILRDGRAEHLIIQRDDDVAQHRLGARSVGRVAKVEPALKGVFVDLGAGPRFGFLPSKGATLAEGARIQVRVVAEPRGSKGPALALAGAGDGEPRLVEAGPDVRALLAELAPGVEPVGGLDAIRASGDAEEEALATGCVLDDLGLDLRIERTRAMTAVDLDWSPITRSTGAQARARANARGLAESARLLRLKAWGGLTAIDLIGTGFDGAAVARTARDAFGDEPGLVLGPVNRFGVLMLSRPWGRRPVDEILLDGSGRRTLRTRVQDLVRGLNDALLADRSTPSVTARCAPEEAETAAPWIRQLGPRARLIADSAAQPGQFQLETA